ncbi:MAG: ATP-dependent Clp protease proteolytic subunit [Pirellulales bacterium]
MARKPSREEEPHDIAVVGDLSDNESDITDKLLAVPEGGECTLYFDCPGGGAYTAISLLTLIAVRRLQATAVVTGECSSAAIWPFAACKRRLVTPLSIFLFHPLKWQSEENIGLAEAREWARHFGQLEGEMDRLLAEFLGLSYERLLEWMQPGRYVSGREMVDAGLAEMIDLAPKKRRP